MGAVPFGGVPAVRIPYYPTAFFKEKDASMLNRREYCPIACGVDVPVLDHRWLRDLEPGGLVTHEAGQPG